MQRRGLIVPTERGFPSKAINSIRRINTHVLVQKRRCALPFPTCIFEESQGFLSNFPKIGRVTCAIFPANLSSSISLQEQGLTSLLFFFFFFFLLNLSWERNYRMIYGLFRIIWNNWIFFSDDVLFIYKNRFLQGFCYLFR